MNINVTLVGFKKGYKLEDSEGNKNTVTIEHRYNVLKRKMEPVLNK